jgi:uncharacterized protein YidB (DUF937 family)
VCRGQRRPKKQTRLDRARLQLTRAELVHLYGQEKWTFFAIGKHFGINSEVVKQLALEYGIHVAAAAAPPQPVAAAWLHQEYVVNQRTLADLAREAGVSGPTLSRRAKELGIPVRRNPRSNPRVPITEEWIYQEHVLNRRTLVDMAQEAGVPYQTLSKWTKKFGIPVRRSPQSNATAPITKEWMYQEYVLNERTLTDMAQEVGVTIQTLSKKAKQAGIRVQHSRRRPADRRSTGGAEA